MGESAQSLALRSRSGPAKNRVYACLVIFSAADRRPRLIAHYAQCLVRPQWNWPPPATSEKWSRLPARRSPRSRSVTRSGNSKPCALTAISFALRVRSGFAWAISEELIQAHGPGTFIDRRTSRRACWLTFKTPSWGRSRSAISSITTENATATAMTARDLRVPARPSR